MNWLQKHILKCTDSWFILIKGQGTGRNIIHAFSVFGSFILQKFERIALTEEALIYWNNYDKGWCGISSILSEDNLEW